MVATDVDELEEATPEGATEGALEACVVTGALLRLLVWVIWRVEVVVESSWAAAREAPATRTVKSMFEICILKVVCGVMD